MRELLAELAQALDDRRDCVYCSVIETRGSTPQKAGASMLVFADGSQRGTLGGGCVEAEVKQRALRVLVADDAQPELMTFSLDDNYGWDDGLICGGRMTILADPLKHLASGEYTGGIAEGPKHPVYSPGANYYRRLHQLAEAGRGCTEAVVMSGDGDALRPASRYLFDCDNSPVAQVADGPAPERVVRQLTPLKNRPRPSVQHGIAYLPVLPRITLLIVGAGHVGQAVAKLAAEVDFDIWVVDDRETFASAERFPTAGRRLVGDIGASLQQLAPKDINPSIYALIMTRGHAHDEEALYHLASTPAGYVGMIGSKRKIKLIFEDLLARGIPSEALERVHAPLGFNIGSQTVPEIAISIVAELIACRNLPDVSPQRKQASKGERPTMSRTFGLIPAAGKSRRMGRPKLSLIWRGKTVLEHTVTAMAQGGVTAVVVVVGPGDTELRALAEKAGAEVLELAVPTSEMRDTVERGLDWIEQRYQPNPDDGWLLLPADHPNVDKDVIQAILAARARERSIVVPTFLHRRGHPVWIAWRHVPAIRQMSPEVGLNMYLRQHAGEAFLLPVATETVLLDLDTPEQFSALWQERTG